MYLPNTVHDNFNRSNYIMMNQQVFSFLCGKMESKTRSPELVPLATIQWIIIIIQKSHAILESFLLKGYTKLLLRNQGEIRNTSLKRKGKRKKQKN